MTSQESNPVAYARGVLQVEAETYKHERDRLAHLSELLVASLDGGHQWEVDHLTSALVHALNNLKDKP